MRKTRGLLFVLIGLLLALASGYMVLNYVRQAAAKAAAVAAASGAGAQATPIPKVYVVIAQKDIPENVAISTDDIAKQEFPAEFAPPGALASPDIAIGKYTTARIVKGEILTAPLISETKKTGALAAVVPEGKVAMAVTVNDSLDSLGALRPGDHVDILLTLDLRGLPISASSAPAPANQQSNPQNGQSGDQNQSQFSTQLTMQNVEILAIGAPAGDAPSTNAPNQNATTTQAQAQLAKVITFLLDHQDAVTLKFIKDSGGTMDLVVRSPDDKELAKTDAVTLDSLYRKYSFRFVQPVNK